MVKKFAPFILLFILAFAFIWIKNTPSAQGDETNFNRHYNSIRYSKHALCRMDCRHIDATEIKEIIARGTVNRRRTQQSEKGTSYALEGKTADGQNVRIIVAPKSGDLVVVTVIDLQREWQCNCN
ncbi:MAG: DUF4258 domain-containing protein [Ferruginibacter sp.]